MTDWIGDTVGSGALLIALPVALAAGLVSFFSPCVVPLLPGYLSYVSGLSVQEVQRRGSARIVTGAMLFVLGFSAVFVLGGAIFGSVGLRLREYQHMLSIVTGLLLIALGVLFIGQGRWLARDVRVHAVPAVGLAAAPLLGVFFGLGWSPCFGPTLSAVLGLAMSTDDTSAARGAVLATAYSIGLGLPFVLAALGLRRLTRVIGWFTEHSQLVAWIGGFVMIAVGVLLLTGVWDSMVIDLQAWVGGFETAL